MAQRGQERGLVTYREKTPQKRTLPVWSLPTVDASASLGATAPLASLAGMPFTSGSRSLAGFVPPHGRAFVTRDKRAGLIGPGKTNLAPFGILCTPEPRLFGPARDPWNPE